MCFGWRRRRCVRRPAGDLERNKLPHFDAEGLGDAAEVVQPDAYAAGFDAPDMRFAAADHEGKALLGDALLAAGVSDCLAERFSFC